MPVYEYRCGDCRRRVSSLVRGFSEPSDITCSFCGSRNLTRLFSTFAVVRTDQDRYEDILNDTDLVKRMMHNDPSALVEWSRRLGGTEGEKTPEYQEMVERLERGESYEKVIPEMQKRLFGEEPSSGPDGKSAEGKED